MALDELRAKERRLEEQLANREDAIVAPWDNCTEAILRRDPDDIEQVLLKVAHRGRLLVETLRELRETRRRIEIEGWGGWYENTDPDSDQEQAV